MKPLIQVIYIIYNNNNNYYFYYFHAHIDYIFSKSLRTLGLIRTLTYSFSTLDCLLLFYSTLVRPKLLEYAFVVWNSVTSTDARKLERIQWKFAALCQNHFFSSFGTYQDFLKNLKLHTLYDRTRFLDALFLSSVYSGLKCCLSLLDATGIRALYAILGPTLCFFLLVKTLQLEYAFWPQTLCLKMLISLGILLPH
jgi:hypothetical protein